MKPVILIGGGFAGLTTAYYLRQKGFSVELHEKSSSWGGLLQTRKTPFGMVEKAANGILKTPLLVNLCKDLGILLLEPNSRSKKRFIYRNQPKRWPLKGVETMKLLPSLMGLWLHKQKKEPQPGQTLAHWGKQNLGSAALNYLLAPALQGIYADTPEKMSASLIMSRFFHPSKKGGGERKNLYSGSERRHGRIDRGSC